MVFENQLLESGSAIGKLTPKHGRRNADIAPIMAHCRDGEQTVQIRAQRYLDAAWRNVEAQHLLVQGDDSKLEYPAPDVRRHSSHWAEVISQCLQHRRRFIEPRDRLMPDMLPLLELARPRRTSVHDISYQI